MTLGILGAIFIIALVLGVPIAFILSSASIVYFTFIGNVPLSIIGQQLFSGADKFVLLAIPFFVLAGDLMNRTGITEDLVKFANVLVGRLPGALAQVNIVVSIIFAGLTGAAVADTAAVGSILIPAMKKQGYSPEYSAAVTTASSIIGPIIPPSVIMVIYGSITGESVGDLFMAGIVPGLLVGIGLMIMTTYYAVKEGHPRRIEKISFKEKLRVTKTAILGLIVPVIIIGGILSGMFTPTEAAAVACFYALSVGIFIFKNLSLKDIIQALRKSAITSAVILLIIATAKLFSVVLMYENIPGQISSLMMGFTQNKFVFLLIINVLLLFMGMVMETGANVVLLAPILLPIAQQYGIDPLHFALIMLVNVNIGLTTPPLGVCLFTAAPIAKVSYEKIARRVLPLVGMEIAVLLLITYVPQIVLFLPRMLGY